MHAVKKYFEKSIVTRIASARRVCRAESPQPVFRRVCRRCRVRSSIRLYQAPTRTRMSEAARAAAANHPTACCP